MKAGPYDYGKAEAVISPHLQWRLEALRLWSNVAGQPITSQEGRRNRKEKRGKRGEHAHLYREVCHLSQIPPQLAEELVSHLVIEDLQAES